MSHADASGYTHSVRRHYQLLSDTLSYTNSDTSIYNNVQSPYPNSFKLTLVG